MASNSKKAGTKPSSSMPDSSKISKKRKAQEVVIPSNSKKPDTKPSSSMPEDSQEEEVELKYLMDEVREYFKVKGVCESLVEKGLDAMDKVKAKAIESRWRKHFRSEFKLKAKRCELEKEAWVVLHAAQKGTNTP